MRAADIIAAVPDLPPDIAMAIRDLDARAYQQNTPVVLGDGQVFLRLLAAVTAAGSQAELARRMGVSWQHLHDVLSSDRAPSPAVLRYLKLKRMPAPARYTPID